MMLTGVLPGRIFSQMADDFTNLDCSCADRGGTKMQLFSNIAINIEEEKLRKSKQVLIKFDNITVLLHMKKRSPPRTI